MKKDLELYLAYSAALGHSPRSVAGSRNRLLGFLAVAARAGVHSLRQIAIEVVRTYHDAMRRKGLAASTRLNMLSSVRCFLRWAHDAGTLQEDLAARIELPRPEKRLPPRPLSQKDLAELFALFPQESRAPARDRVILELLYACGLRKSELLGLDVGDIDLDQSTIFVRSGKGNKDRVLPMHRRAASRLRTFLLSRGQDLPRNTPLFVARPATSHLDSRLSTSSLDALFRQANRSFHKHLYPHLFRHTFAVHMLLGGADLRHVQALLGHESPNTTSRYLGLAKEDLKRGYDKATAIVLGRRRSKKRAGRG